MLKSIHILNYESHKNSKLTFAPGLNVIIGSSDQGKSAILRAFNWVFFNKPVGDAFRSKWGGDTQVKVEMDEASVTRVKGKENKYILQKPNEKPMVFKAFGANVPTEIQRVINISPINIQNQFDSHFLLPPISPGEVARQINQFVNLEIIDKALLNINSKIRNLEQHSASIQIGINTLETDINMYSNLEKAEELLTKLEKIEARIDTINNNYYQLEKMIHTLEDINEKLKKYKNIGCKNRKLAALERRVFNITQIRQYIEKINYFIEKQKSFEKSKIRDLLEQRETYLRSLLTLKDKIKEAQWKEQNANKIISSLVSVENKIKSNTTKINKKEREFEKLLPKGSQCPLCGKII